MTEAVLDASVVLKWFHVKDEPNVQAAHALRARFEAGELNVLAPSLLWLELLNVAARRWGWPPSRLEEFTETLLALHFLVLEPALSSVARWAGRGLTAYDAAYIALAEQAGAQLITEDSDLIAAGGALVVPLAAVSESA